MPSSGSHHTAPVRERRIMLLGSTGSIGTQAVDVIENLNALAERGASPVRYRVVGLAAGKNAAALFEQARRLSVRDLALVENHSGAPPGCTLRTGSGAAERLVREVECDIVLGAMVGAAGLPATLAAIELGRDVALANKETLVAAGELVIPAAQRSGSKLLPVDSEHAGVWQCLPNMPCPPVRCGPDIARIVLTASGGPFRTWSAQDIARATPEQALNHPTWAMGPKVTIDSASLTNKALEVIEAHWLFGVDADRIGVVIHPQSIVHALVELSDGNVLAQLAPPDMRTPIQIALTYPDRAPGCSKKLDWRAMSRLDFEQPDLGRFPALALAFDVIRAGGTAGAVFNAANEAAVEAFLARQIPFGMIPALSRAALAHLGASPIRSLGDVFEADREARRFVQRKLAATMTPA